MNYKKILKKETVIIGVSILAMLTLLIGTSYAIFSQIKASTNTQVLSAGTLNVTYTSGTTMSGSLVPMSDEEGIEQSGYQMIVTNTGTLPMKYNLVVTNAYSSGTNNLEHEYIKISIDGSSPVKLSTLTKTSDTQTETNENNMKRVLLKNQIVNETGTTGSSKTHIVKVWIDEEAPEEIVNKKFSLNVLVEGTVYESPSFATSSWSDIIAAYNSGDTEQLETDMENGVTRDVDLGELGVHPVRIANLTPCSTANTVSQSACGLVIEFADIISERQMNPYTDGTINGDGNKGGWEYSDMRAYVNSTTYTAGNIDYSSTGIYLNMPSDLKPLIISTSVVSGHGSNDSSNFTTDDYMYLLSRREVWNYQGSLDTASQTDSVTNKEYTRQLDYYNTKGVTTSSYSAAIKQDSGSNANWWLRSADSGSTSIFNVVNISGYYSDDYSDSTNGVSPAFRLAE